MSSDEQSDLAQERVRPIIEWLTSAHGQAKLEDVDILRQHLETLRAVDGPAAQHLQLLDFLYEHSNKVIDLFLPSLHDISLPISRKARQQIRGVQALLETLSQDYLDALKQLFDPQLNNQHRNAGVALWRSINSLATHLLISNLAAAPAEVGIWQLMHSAYRIARRHNLAEQRVPRQPLTLEQVYLASILLASSQPASFSSLELEFIAEYIRLGIDELSLCEEFPSGCKGVFWIDPDRDIPANPMIRRTPAFEVPLLWYFSCDGIAQSTREHLDALRRGYPAHQLGLPPFADTAAGHGILQRLAERWGKPPKRRFPRRRHSYRATLYSGLETIWQLLQAPEAELASASQWMVTNESPDGCSMMHVSGKTTKLRVGDLVAIRADPDGAAASTNWSVCIVRWGISENPEHIELGLQILAPTALPAVLSLPHASTEGAQTSAILLPGIPPLRPHDALVVHTGAFPEQSGEFTLVVDSSQVKVRELHTIGISEQTSSIEIFNVAMNEKN